MIPYFKNFEMRRNVKKEKLKLTYRIVLVLKQLYMNHILVFRTTKFYVPSRFNHLV